MLAILERGEADLIVDALAGLPFPDSERERLFACLDPFGYEWKFSVPIPGMEGTDGTQAARESWFGTAD